MPAKTSGRSSASSATRKKHQRKAAVALGIDLETPPKTQGKPKNKDKSGRAGGSTTNKKDGKKSSEPRVKAYIPPVKPARAQPDPLEVGGLARRLPPELVVVLRNVGKKAQVTKIRALEELGSAWVERALVGGGREEEEGVDVALSLVEMIPAWVHYIPPLFIHPSRRVRLLSISTHLNLLKIPEVRNQVLFYLKEAATSEELESVLGSWYVLIHDVDKSVSSVGRDAWDTFVRHSSTTKGEEDKYYVLDASSKKAIFSFVQRTVMDPLGVYAYLNPPPASAAPTPPTPNPKNQRSGGGAAAKGKQQQLVAAIAAARRMGNEENEPVKSKAEEYDESEVDRRARLRIGGVGGLRWFLELDKDGISEGIMELLKNPILWTVLYHAERAPFVVGTQVGAFGGAESFGFGQPNVRKSGWGLLMTLLQNHKERIQPIVPVLSSTVLRSAWAESDTLVQAVMWSPLLTYIKDFPNCWNLELERGYNDDKEVESEDEEDEEEGEDEDEGERTQQSEKVTQEVVAPKIPKPSLAYQEFLQFLQLGCSGSPVQGYPTVMIILSTIPSSIMASSGTKTPLEDLFTSLWAALDGRALSSLHRATTSAAFLSAVLECTGFMARRLILDGSKVQEEIGGSESALASDGISNVKEEAHKLIQTQYGKVWEELKSGRLKVEERAAARLIAQNLESLQKIGSGLPSSQGTVALFEAAWGALRDNHREAVRANPGLVATFTKVLFDHFREGTNGRMEVEGFVHEVLGDCVENIQRLLSVPGEEDVKDEVRFLESMLEQFREGIFEDEAFSQKSDELVKTHTAPLLESSPSLLFSYLAHRKNEERTLELWYAILVVIARNVDDPDKTRKVASGVIHAIQKGGLPSYLKPKANELDRVVENLLAAVLGRGGDVDAGDLGVVKAILGAHEHFISQGCYTGLFVTIAEAFNSHVELLIVNSTEDIALTALGTPLELLDMVMKHLSSEQKENLSGTLLPNLFLFGYVVPECSVLHFDSTSDAFGVAREIWEREADSVLLGTERRQQVLGSVKVKLSDLLIDTHVRPLPEEIIRALATQGRKLGNSLLDDIFPSSSSLDRMLERLPHDPLDYSLAVIEPLIPPDVKPSSRGPEATDSRGFSSYARVINTLLSVFLQDRQLARQNLWALRHFIALSIYASDYQKVPAGTSPVFDSKALAGLGDIITKVKQVTAYLFLGSLATVQDDWRRNVVKAAGEGKYGSGKGGTLEAFVEDAIGVAVESDSVLDTRVLKVVLEDALEDLETGEAEDWVGLAKKLEKSAPQTSMTLIAAIAETGAEPARLDRYRNEQAAELLGIKANKINTSGLLTLRRLGACAPDLESDVVFLPQNRALNVVKACQAWVTSDDADIDEEVESAMTLIFEYLAPILQNVPGSHWDFIWDVLENSFENSSITDDESLVTLTRSLRLVIIMEDLVRTNKPLKAEWEHRRMKVMEMVKDLALTKLDVISPSLPRSTCRELVLAILRYLPESLVDEHTLPKMCHLVTDHSLEVQKNAYSVLQMAARKRTEHLVIEAGVDTESNVKATLPLELLDIIQSQANFANVDDEDEEQSIFGSLLGWMLMFDLFQNASFKVKSEYIEQMRNLDLVAANFIPLFIALLRLEGGLTKGFKLDVWAVNEYYIELFEPGNPISISLLAAHLYYRALLSVPSLIHSWLSDCKDRQLSMTMTTYTSQYFSPIIIEAELAHVKGPAGQELADDSLSVKVAAAVNEVQASYLVDEHQLEIKLKIPSDWPLHKIEVKDMKRVGVDENRWRAWILAVQQTIWSHNGRLTDGLSLFKKNVTLHFEGQVECAICYSIISVMDGSLPKKPCKTCKNKFHAGCLYKWFNTSHSSSCPLCRSDVI